jgi:uncharacterized protein (TIGR02996 family)
MAGDPRAVLMRDIFDDPDDDLPRLVLGDWLADHGDPRGEFIQIDVRLAAGVSDAAERERLERRRLQLLAGHAVSWLGPLADLASQWEFRRGLVHLTVRAAKLVDGLGILSDEEADWVISLEVTELHVTRLGLPAVVNALTRFPSLDLSRNPLGNDGVQRLLRSDDASRLRHLDLNRCLIGDRGVTALAGRPDLRALRSLSLRHSRFGEVGAMALLESPHLDRLRRLDLRNCELSPETKDEFRHRFGDRVLLSRG